jgi:hypothetical protein
MLLVGVAKGAFWRRNERNSVVVPATNSVVLTVKASYVTALILGTLHSAVGNVYFVKKGEMHVSSKNCVCNLEKIPRTETGQ